MVVVEGAVPCPTRGWRVCCNRCSLSSGEDVAQQPQYTVNPLRAPDCFFIQMRLFETWTVVQWRASGSDCGGTSNAVWPAVGSFYRGQDLQMSVFLVQSSLLSKYTPKYLYSSIMSTLTPLMETGDTGALFLFMSTPSSLVFATLSCRWFCSHQVTKLSITPLYSVSSPLLIHPTTGHHSVVYRVKREGERTVPCGSPVLPMAQM